MDFLKIIGICLCGAGAAILLSDYKKEYSAVISFGVGAFVLVTALGVLIPKISQFSTIFGAHIGNGYFFAALKAVAIGYISQFAADTCRDFGQAAIAAKAELAGKIMIFLITLPVLQDLFGMITKIV